MPIHLLKLIAREEIARQTVQFSFAKPAGFDFKPGQYGGFTLINPSITDARGITRRFSFLSTPQDETLMIATRLLDSAYKKVLMTMPLGSEIKFAGPTGNFTLHDDPSIPAVFIAGGIGIAPFYSMIRAAIAAQRTQSLLLLYGNQTRADAPFLLELQTLAHSHPHFKCVPVLAMPEADWQGETGWINAALIQKYVKDLTNPIFYVCGSPVMVTTLQETLAELEIAAEQIRIEDFTGY